MHSPVYRLASLMVCLLALAACSSAPPGTPTPAPTPGGPNAPLPFTGTLTLEDYDWFAVNPWLGVTELALPSGQKTRVLDGAYPWRHPGGKVVFAQGCGEDVNRVAIAEDGLITPVTPCSSEIPNPGVSPTSFEFSRLSPDEQRVAAEAQYFLDGEFRYDTLVFDLAGQVLTRYEGAVAPAWLPDGRLLLVGSGVNGVYRTDAGLQNPVRIDGGQLNGPVGNLDVNPAGTLVALEYNQQIWLLDLATGAVREFVSGDRRLRYPTFSPDGAALAYLATSQGDRYDPAVYFTDLATGTAYALPYPAEPGNVSNVPNGPLSWTR